VRQSALERRMREKGSGWAGDGHTFRTPVRPSLPNATE
jgi:hypothetical protein